MTLSEILEAAANRMSDTTVEVSSNRGTVDIRPHGVFLQGEDATVLISEVEHLWNLTGNLSRHPIELALAEPYVENLT